MTTTNQSGKLGFIKRLFLAFIKLLFLVIVLAALAAVGWFAYQEITRSFNSVAKRMDVSTQRIEETDSEIAALLTRIDDQQEEIIALKTAIATQDEHIAALTEESAEEQARQDDMLVALDAQVAGSVTDDISALSEGLVALQNDITNNGAQIDELGGKADGLQGDVTKLQGDIDDLNIQLDETQATLANFPAVEIVKMRQILALFRIWELTGRARLRLLEGNAGLAETDVKLALAAANEIVAFNADEELTGLVQPVQERLALVPLSLPDDPVAAARDLETAWESLDEALVRLLRGEE